MRLALDSNVLGMVIHPRKHADVRAWFWDALAPMPPRHDFFVPEIADYELRRELIRSGARLRGLDRLARMVPYVALDTATMRDAAALWADLRRGGRPTADPKSLDADVILAAQARRIGAAVVTTNVRHIARLVQAVRWEDL